MLFLFAYISLKCLDTRMNSYKKDVDPTYNCSLIFPATFYTTKINELQYGTKNI